MENKVCSKCKIEKELSEFHFKNKTKNIKMSRCKICSKNAYKCKSRTACHQNNIEKRREYARSYYINNKEKASKANKKYNKDNIEKIQIRTKKYREKNKEHIKKYQTEYKNNNQIKLMLLRAYQRAKKRGYDFTITKYDIIIPEKCPALGIELKYNNKPQMPSSPSLDRLDSAKGYTKENINVISGRANIIKSDATFEEFEAIYKWWKAELAKRKKIDQKLLKVNTGETNVVS